MKSWFQNKIEGYSCISACIHAGKSFLGNIRWRICNIAILYNIKLKIGLLDYSCKSSAICKPHYIVAVIRFELFHNFQLGLCAIITWACQLNFYSPISLYIQYLFVEDQSFQLFMIDYFCWERQTLFFNIYNYIYLDYFY